MKLNRIIYLLLLIWGATSLWAADSKPARDILGLRLSMTESAVRQKLKKLGSFARAVPPRQEVWQIKNEHFSAILVGFNKDGQLRYITAVARTDKDGKKMTYATVGDLAKARQAGDPKINNFNYQWELAEKGDEPKTMVIAIGRDPKSLSTLSLKRLGEPVAKEEDDD